MRNTEQIIADMQRKEREKVKARIKALTEKTVENGCSEAEAMAAAAMIGKLLTQYNLTMDEIDLREETFATVRIDGRVSRGDPMFSCVMGIAAFCDCKTWFTQGNRYQPNRYSFFGHESDTQMVVYLFNVIQEAIVTEVATFKKTDAYRNAYSKKGATTSFQTGMANRIGNRLYQMKREQNDAIQKAEEERQKRAAEQALKASLREKIFEAARGEIDEAAFEDAFADLIMGRESALDGVWTRVRQTATDHVETVKTTGTSLMLLKGKLVEQEFIKTGPKLRRTRTTRRITDGGAYNRGSEAGSKVNLNRPIGGGSASGGYLT